MNLSKILEHTLLKPNASQKDIAGLLDEAMKYKFGGVCLPPYFVKEAFRRLEGTGIRLITVVGFPLGYNMTITKNEELKRAIDDGADDLDVVLNIAAVYSKDWAYTAHEIETLTRSSHLRGKRIKLILEAGLLDTEQLQKVIRMGLDSGVDVLKTSTGFNGQVVSPEMVALIRSIAGDQILIKASGGIKTWAEAQKVLEAGADLIGTSNSVQIVREYVQHFD